MLKILLHGGYPGFWEGAGNDLPFFTKLIEEAKLTDNKILMSFLSAKTLQKADAPLLFVKELDFIEFSL